MFQSRSANPRVPECRVIGFGDRPLDLNPAIHNRPVLYPKIGNLRKQRWGERNGGFGMKSPTTSAWIPEIATNMIAEMLRQPCHVYASLVLPSLRNWSISTLPSGKTATI